MVTIRPRLLAASLAAAVVVGVVGGWAVYRLGATADVPDDVVLTEPGEYQQPLDAEAAARDRDASGEPFPAVDLTDAAGLVVPSASLVGGPLVVNVWFSTCPPCARELADFAAVHREVGDRVRFVGVNPFDGVEVMLRFAAERGVAYELYRDDEAAFLDAAGVASFPRTLLVDAGGTVVSQHGELHADDLRRLVGEHFGVEVPPSTVTGEERS